MRINILAAIFAFAPLIAGCDIFYGVSRYADDLPAPPNAECVVGAMKSVDGVSKVEYRYVPDTQKVATLHGIDLPDQRHTFLYEYDGIPNALSYTTGYDLKTRYQHGFGCINCPQTPEFISRAKRLHPVMKKIDQAIEERCKLTGLTQAIHEIVNLR